MREVQSRQYSSIKEIIEDAKQAGSHFFDTATMKFFSSRILPTLYNGRYFITSERDSYRDSNPRVYTVREYMGGGDIRTVGVFGQYRFRQQAHSAIRKLIKSGGV